MSEPHHRGFSPGECCNRLNNVLRMDTAQATLRVDDGMLWIGLGYRSIDERVAWIGERVDFCPFCGLEIDHFGEEHKQRQ